MSEKVEFRRRALRAAGINLVLAGLAALALPASAQQAQATPLESSQAMTVVRDAETGKLRAATADEQQVLQQAAKTRTARVAPATTLQKFHASGARGARLTDEFMSTSVAVRKADGGIATQCYESHGAATTAVSSGHTHATTPETE
jgi:hypothetical protein